MTDLNDVLQLTELRTSTATDQPETGINGKSYITHLICEKAHCNHLTPFDVYGNVCVCVGKLMHRMFVCVRVGWGIYSFECIGADTSVLRSGSVDFSADRNRL